MKKVNVVYEYEYDHVDIILVPDAIAENIQSVVNDFFKWLSNDEHAKRFMRKGIDGKETLVIGSGEFLWWLNEVVLLSDSKATMIQDDTVFCPELPMADF